MKEQQVALAIGRVSNAIEGLLSVIADGCGINRVCTDPAENLDQLDYYAFLAHARDELKKSSPDSFERVRKRLREAETVLGLGLGFLRAVRASNGSVDVVTFQVTRGSVSVPAMMPLMSYVSIVQDATRLRTEVSRLLEANKR